MNPPMLMPLDVASHDRIAVVIPCFKVRNFVLSVIERIPPHVASIHVVDDGCPERTGRARTGALPRSASDV